MAINVRDLEAKLNAANTAAPVAPATPVVDTASIQAITTDDNSKSTPAINAEHIDSLGIAILMLNDLLLTASERILAIENYINSKEAPEVEEAAPVAPEAIVPATTPATK